jgi:transposase
VWKSPYPIELSEEERRLIEVRARSSNAPFRQVMRARVILYLANGDDNSVIATRLDVSRSFVSELRKRFFQERLKALEERPRTGRPARFSPQRGRVGQSGGV